MRLQALSESLWTCLTRIRGEIVPELLHPTLSRAYSSPVSFFLLSPPVCWKWRWYGWGHQLLLPQPLIGLSLFHYRPLFYFLLSCFLWGFFLFSFLDTISRKGRKEKEEVPYVVDTATLKQVLLERQMGAKKKKRKESGWGKTTTHVHDRCFLLFFYFKIFFLSICFYSNGYWDLKRKPEARDMFRSIQAFWYITFSLFYTIDIRMRSNHLGTP